MKDRISISIANHVADVRLIRSDKMNALDPAMFEALVEAIETLGREPDLRAVVLSGEGRAFCAGLDLSNFAGNHDPDLAGLEARTHGLANRAQYVAWGWRELEVPVIAAVHGIAFGGGFQIMSGADIRIIHPDTRCSIMEMRWGLVPDMGGYALWRGNVRDDLLRRLVYTNEEFSGQKACEFGFATECDTAPLERAFALANLIVDKNPHAIRASKRLSNMLWHASDAELLVAESVEQDQIIYKPNQVEAVTAQMEKRRPVFER